MLGEKVFCKIKIYDANTDVWCIFVMLVDILRVNWHNIAVN